VINDAEAPLYGFVWFFCFNLTLSPSHQGGSVKARGVRQPSTENRISSTSRGEKRMTEKEEEKKRYQNSSHTHK
jgi:hypothetical protein